MKRNDMSVFRTKSGTKVFVDGSATDRRLRERIGAEFVKYFNNNFTEAEQRQISNIYYDVYNTQHTGTQVPRPRMDKASWIAQTGTFTGKDAQELNPGYKKMVDMSFQVEARDDEHAITHEMIHAKKFMNNVKGREHNERKIDFEAVGRVSKRGICNIQHGYYFSPMGNQALRQKKGISLQKKGEIAKQGALDDRLLLTGSLERSVIGKPIEEKTDKLFRRSFFFKRNIY